MGQLAEQDVLMSERLLSDLPAYKRMSRPGAQALFYSFSDEVTPYVSNEHRLDFNDHRGGNLELKGH